MPTTYTHYRFGDKARLTLDNKYQEMINSYRDIFDFGVHGPDIFFYYKPLKKNDVSAYGNKLHYLPAREFFKKCKEVLSNHKEKEAMMSYILGFLTHFTLDSMCHSYVDRKKEVSGISHTLIETEYDRHMMLKDNINPLKFNRADCLNPTKFGAHVISYFFDYDESIVLESIQTQKTLMNLLHTPITFKRTVLRGFIGTAVSKDSEYKELFIDDKENIKCKDSNLRLDKLSEKALELYPKLANNLLKYFDDKEELNDYFNNHFGFREDYKEIPILSYEEELNYKV